MNNTHLDEAFQRILMVSHRSLSFLWGALSPLEGVGPGRMEQINKADGSLMQESALFRVSDNLYFVC